MSNIKDIRCNPRLQDLVLAGWPPCCMTSFVVVIPVTHATSYFCHEKRVHHKLLLHRLCVHFGIRGKALAWFTSYLTGHRQYVTIRGADSSSCSIMHGVPRGSVLGPLLYLLYTIPLGSIVRKHGMMFHFYADDSQIYFSFDSSTPELVNASRLEAFVKDFSDWMSANKLKLNSDKTSPNYLC